MAEAAQHLSFLQAAGHIQSLPAAGDGAGPGAGVGHRTAAFHGGAQRAQPGGAEASADMTGSEILTQFDPRSGAPPRKHNSYPAPLTALFVI